MRQAAAVALCLAVLLASLSSASAQNTSIVAEVSAECRMRCGAMNLGCCTVVYDTVRQALIGGERTIIESVNITEQCMSCTECIIPEDPTSEPGFITQNVQILQGCGTTITTTSAPNPNAPNSADGVNFKAHWLALTLVAGLLSSVL